MRQVPITYTREMAWATELLRLLPTIGLIGLYIWFTRRQLGGGFGGGGGMGGRGIFNVGKAQVCWLRPHLCASMMVSAGYLFTKCMLGVGQCTAAAVRIRMMFAVVLVTRRLHLCFIHLQVYCKTLVCTDATRCLTYLHCESDAGRAGAGS